MKLRDTLSATLLAHADAPRRWKTPLSPDPAKAYPIWLLALRTLLWAILFTGVASLLTSDNPGAYPTLKDSVYVDLNAKYAK